MGNGALPHGPSDRAHPRLYQRRGIAVRAYARSEVRESFSRYYAASTKQAIAEVIARHIPAFKLYVPPARKPWMTEHQRMGIFEAAALAWMYFHDKDEGREAACEEFVLGCVFVIVPMALLAMSASSRKNPNSAKWSRSAR
jgi:hypothetical protein